MNFFTFFLHESELRLALILRIPSYWSEVEKKKIEENWLENFIDLLMRNMSAEEEIFLSAANFLHITMSVFIIVSSNKAF